MYFGLFVCLFLSVFSIYIIAWKVMNRCFWDFSCGQGLIKGRSDYVSEKDSDHILDTRKSQFSVYLNHSGFLVDITPKVMGRSSWIFYVDRYLTQGINDYMLGVLRRFQHYTGHITMGSWKGRGNQYIQFVRVLYCKLPTNDKQLPAFPLEAMPGTEPRPQRWEARVLPLFHHGPITF